MTYPNTARSYKLTLLRKGYRWEWCERCKDTTLHRPHKVPRKNGLIYRMRKLFKCTRCGKVEKP